MRHELYSVNALSLTLQRDRAAVTKALAAIEPDGFERNQPRWTIATAVRALERRNYRPNRNSNRYVDKFHFHRPTRLDALRHDFDDGLTAIAEAKGRDEKMALALRLAPLIEIYGQTYRELARTLNHCDEVAIEARSSLIYSEMMESVRQASAWPDYKENDPRRFHICLMRAMPSAAEFGDDYEGYDAFGEWIGGDGDDAAR
jgi:hypothetical protein